MTAKSGPLAGLRVVEMAGIGPCPLAGQLLADLGADVVSIDRKSLPADPTDILRRGKRSIALDLKTSSGLSVALKLISRADILIEGFRPGVMERMGLGPDECRRENAALVYGRMTGWGQTGPLASTAGHDLNYLSITGALAAMGSADKPPTPPLNYVADYGGGTMFLLFGILSALYERGQSGEGQVVDASMVDGVAAMSSLMHSFRARGSWDDARESNLLDGGAPFYRCYETADGKWISVGPLEPQFFAELVKKAGLPNAYCTDQNDKANWAERRDAYAKIFRQKTRDEWVAIFENSDACVAPVLNWNEAAEHSHNQARGTFYRADNVLQAAPAPRFDRTPPATPDTPTAAGSDNESVLQGLGFSETEIRAMETDGTLR